MRSARVWVRASEGFAGCERLSMTMAGDTNKSEPRRWSFMPTAHSVVQRQRQRRWAMPCLPCWALAFSAVLGACLLCCARRVHLIIS